MRFIFQIFQITILNLKFEQVFYWYTLVYQIDVQCEINVQVGKFLKNIKLAGQNRRAGRKINLKNIKGAGRNNRAGGNFCTYTFEKVCTYTFE